MRRTCGHLTRSPASCGGLRPRPPRPPAATSRIASTTACRASSTASRTASLSAPGGSGSRRRRRRARSRPPRPRPTRRGRARRPERCRRPPERGRRAARCARRSRSIEMVTSRPSVSFFSIDDRRRGSRCGAGAWAASAAWAANGGVTVTCSVEPIGRLNGGSFDRISALIRSSTESSAKRFQVMRPASCRRRGTASTAPAEKRCQPAPGRRGGSGGAGGSGGRAAGRGRAGRASWGGCQDSRRALYGAAAGATNGAATKCDAGTTGCRRGRRSRRRARARRRPGRGSGPPRPARAGRGRRDVVALHQRQRVRAGCRTRRCATSPGCPTMRSGPARQSAISASHFGRAAARWRCLDVAVAADHLRDARDLDRQRRGWPGRGRAAPPRSTARYSTIRLALGAALLGAAERIERRAAQALQPREDAERRQHPRPEALLLQLALGVLASRSPAARGGRRAGSPCPSRLRTAPRRLARKPVSAVQAGDLVLVLVGHQLEQVARHRLGQLGARPARVGPRRGAREHELRLLGRAPCRRSALYCVGVGRVLVGGEELDPLGDQVVEVGRALDQLDHLAGADQRLHCLAGRAAARRPHSNAALLFSTCTPFSSIARISAAWLSGTRPCCQA